MQVENTIGANSPNGQKYLGNKGLILLIAFLGTFIPMSTDLYLPALPGMTENLHTTVNLMNLTLIMFFVFYSAAMLFWGPMSDKYGRKSVLIAGLALYVIASFLGSQSATVYQLIASRILQGIGGGAVTAVETAIVKDVYAGRKRETVLALVQTMVVIAPVIAPMLGAFLLSFVSWRGAFYLMTIFGLLGIVGALLFQETLSTRLSGNIRQTVSRLSVVLKNPGFSSLLLTFSLANMGMLGYIGVSSYIYVDGFGLSEQTYSYFFAANALVTMLGPLAYIHLSKRVKRKPIVTACLAMIVVGGLLICTVGQMNPWLFAIAVVPASIAGSMLRPPSVNLMLEQQETDTGSASSLIGSVSLLMGSMGMMIVSLGWANRIVALGTLNVLVGVTSSLLWAILSTKPFVKQLAPLPETN